MANIETVGLNKKKAVARLLPHQKLTSEPDHPSADGGWQQFVFTDCALSG